MAPTPSFVPPRTWGWYSKSYVLWNIAEQLWDRELSLECYRVRDRSCFHQKSMTAANMTYLKHRLTHRRERPVDVFTSLEVYDLEPALGLSHEEKTRFFAEAVPRGWTVAFDLDAEDPVRAAVDLVSLLGLLRRELPEERWSIAFSGGKGFHVQGESLAPYTEGKQANKRLAEYAKGMGLQSVDTVIYTPRREWRCPYSIHHKGLVKLPLDLVELNKFLRNLPDSTRWLFPNQVLQRYRVKGRGMVFQEIENGAFALLLDTQKKLKKVVE